MRTPRWRTTECVTPGHPDKVCDQIADAILDAALAQDPYSRVAMEVHGKSFVIGVNGEITTRAQLDFAEIARATLRSIGYTDDYGVVVNITRQSGNIGAMVDQMGAGDQGIMTGYATNETPELMPLPWVLAQRLCARLVEARTSGDLAFLRPDGKSQVVLQGTTVRNVTIAAHYQQGTPLDKLRRDVIEQVIKRALPELNLDPERMIVNGGGEFFIGGLVADAGTTGRKIVVDQYGPEAPVGGGAFSGKDPTKVDRSAAYMARYVANSIVASGRAQKALVTVSYTIGQPNASMVSVQTDLPEEDEALLEDTVRETFDFRPAAIIERLGLRQPNGWSYQETAALGHYGNSKFPWEQPLIF